MSGGKSHEQQADQAEASMLSREEKLNKFGVTGYGPTLQIPKFDQYANRVVNEVHSGLSTVAESLGERVAGPVGQHLSKRVGEISKKTGEQYSPIAGFVYQDNFEHRVAFHKAVSVEEKIKHLTQLGMNMNVARQEDIGLNYELDIMKTQTGLMNFLLKDLHVEDVRLAAEIDLAKQKISEIEQSLHAVQAIDSKTSELILEKYQQALQHISAVKKELNLQFNQRLTELEVNLSERQEQNVNRLLAQYGMRVDKAMLRADNNYRVMQGQIAKVLDNFDKRAEQQAIQAKFDGAVQAFGAITAIGQAFGNRDVARVGIIGQSAVKIAFSVGQLTGSFGIAAVTGLAALGPMSAIVMAGLSIFGAFGGGGGSGLKKIAKQIQAMHMEMRSSFNRVMRNQEAIYKALLRGLEYMVDGVKLPIISQLNSIEEELLQSQAIASQERQQIHLHELRDLLAKADAYLELDDDELEKQLMLKFAKYESQLANWLKNESRCAMYTGTLHLRNYGTTDKIASIGRILEIQKPQHVVGLLAHVAKEFDSEFPVSVKIDQLFNLSLWCTAMPIYSQIRAHLKMTSKRQATQLVMQTMTKNMMQFMGYLQGNPRLYQVISERYQHSMQQLEALLDKKYQAMKQQNKTLKNASLGDYLSTKEAIDDQIMTVIEHANSYAQLIRSYAELSGLSVTSDAFCLPSKTQILEQELAWADKNFAEVEVAQDRGMTTLMHKQNGVETAYLVQINCEGALELRSYSAADASWRQVAPAYDLGLEKLSGQCDLQALSYGQPGQEKIVVFLSLTQFFYSHCSIHCYDPNCADESQSWQTLPTPQFQYRTYFNSIRLDKMRVDGAERIILVSNGCGTSLEMLYLDGQDQQASWSSTDVLLRESGSQTHWNKSLATVLLQSHGSRNDLRKIRSFDIVVQRGEERDTLFALFLHRSSRYIYQLDLENEKWSRKKDMPRLGNDYYCDPSVFETIESHLIKIDGKDNIVTSARGANGMFLFAYDIEANAWQRLPETEAPQWSNRSNYRHSYYYPSLRTEKITIRGQNYLVSAIRNSKNATVYLYDFAEKAWQKLLDGPEWTDQAGFNAPEVLRTIQLIPITVSEQHQEILYFCRHQSELQGIQFKALLPSHHLTLSNSIEEVANLFEKLQSIKQQTSIGSKALSLLPLCDTSVLLQRYHHELASTDGENQVRFMTGKSGAFSATSVEQQQQASVVFFK